jgi:hypothetical protein
LTQKQSHIKKKTQKHMNKLVVLFVAITFLVTFTLIGCNQPAAPPAPEKGAPGAAGVPAPAPAK